MTKPTLRHHFKTLRASLSPSRHAEAALTLATHPFTGLVGSFASFGTEIDTSPLNSRLAAEKRLALPRWNKQDNTLTFYLAHSNTPIPKEALDTLLVPGLAFDSHHHRLGYGKGCYDRFLPLLTCPTIGIGFTEQHTPTLPTAPHDAPLTSLLLL